MWTEELGSLLLSNESYYGSKLLAQFWNELKLEESKIRRNKILEFENTLIDLLTSFTNRDIACLITKEYCYIEYDDWKGHAVATNDMYYITIRKMSQMKTTTNILNK